MNGPDGKPFKTRAGGVLKLRDLIDMVDAKAAERLTAGGFAADLEKTERAEIARMVGVAALKFADLSNPRTTDYVFDVDRFTAFEGKTGPYLLYASVRMRSVLARAGEAPPTLDAAALRFDAEEERQLALVLLQFGDAMRAAAERRMPHHLCDHAFSVAQSFRSFTPRAASPTRRTPPFAANVWR